MSDLNIIIQKAVDTSRRGILQKNFLRVLSLVIYSLFGLYSLTVFSRVSLPFIQSNPLPYSYRSDEYIFLRTYYLIKDHHNYYDAFRTAVGEDARAIRLTKDAFTWRLPTIFFIWVAIANQSIVIGWLFIACTFFALIAAERIVAKFLRPPWSLLSGVMLMPYFIDAYYYKTSLFFTEWWGWFFFIFALAFFLYDRRVFAWFLFLLSALTRELFIFPLIVMLVTSLIQRRNVSFFLSVVSLFLFFYWIHFHFVQSQNVPDAYGTILTRIKGFDLYVIQKAIAFSMRQYPLLNLKLPLLIVVSSCSSVIYGLFKYWRESAQRERYFLLLASVSFLFVMPFTGGVYNDYWGITFMPTLILLFPLTIFFVRFRWIKIYWPVSLMVAWILIFFRNILFGNGLFFASDILRQYYPWYLVTAGSLKKLALPLWMPSMQAGFPLFAEGETAALYPIFQSVFIFFSSSVAFSLIYPVHFFLLFFFSYTFLRCLKLTQFASFLGSFCYSFGLFFVTKIIHPSIIMSSTWFPVGLMMVHLWVTQGRKTWLLIPLVILIQIVAGHPQITFISVVGYVLYSFLSLFFLTHAAKKKYITHLLKLILLICTGFLLSALQVVPTMELVKHSDRPIHDANFLFSFSLPVSHLLTFVLPNAFGRITPDSSRGLPWYGGNYWEFALYIGIVPFLLALANFLMRKKSPQQNLFLVFSTLFILLAIGGYLKPYRLLIRVVSLWFPFPFRVSSRFLLIGTLGMAALCSFAADRLFMTLQNRRFVALIKISLAIIVMADLYLYGYSYNAVYNRDQILAKPAIAEMWDNKNGSQRLYTEASFLPTELAKKTLQPNINLLWNIDSLAISSPLTLVGYADILQKEFLPVVLPRLNVSTFTSLHVDDRFPKRRDEQEFYTYDISNPLPRHFLTDRIITKKDYTSAIAHLVNKAHKDNQMAVDEEINLKSTTLGSNDLLRLVGENNTNVRFKTTTFGERVLVYLDNYYPGWRVLEDGREQQLLRINGLFKGVKVSEGDHETQFFYAPSSLALGAIVSMMGILCYSLLFCTSRRKY